jgi:hypothetical protein
MKVHMIIGAHAYACIKTETISLDVRLEPGRSAKQSMLESVAEMRAQAERLMCRAELIEQASELL